MDSEFCGELEDGVGGNVRGDVIVSFALIADVDEAVINAHFEFGGGLIAASLVVVEFFQTL